MPRKTPSVVLVGRPNVGKSTLFNRMTGSRRAIVAPIAGTTRDALARPVDLARDVASNCSTRAGCSARARIRCTSWSSQQGQRAIAGADLLVFLVDGREGLVAGDETIARELRADRPAGAARDQQDRRQARAATARWSSTSSGSIRCSRSPPSTARASAICSTRSWRGSRLEAEGSGRRGRGTASRRATPQTPARSPPASTETGVAIVGRPNVGKSSLVNRLLQRRARAGQRHAGHDARCDRRAADLAPPALPHRRHGRHAAARARVAAAARWSWSASRGAKKAIADADVVALVIDANDGRDRSGRGDRRRSRPRRPRHRHRREQVGSGEEPRTTTSSKTFDDELRRRMRFLDYAPILHISALTGERTPKVLETIDKVAAARRKRVPTPALNKFVETVTAANPPVSPGRRARADPVRGADRRRAAVVRVLHQRRDDVSFLLRAVPHQPAARAVRLRRHADPHPGAAPRRAKCAPERRQAESRRERAQTAQTEPSRVSRSRRILRMA